MKEFMEKNGMKCAADRENDSDSVNDSSESSKVNKNKAN